MAFQRVYDMEQADKLWAAGLLWYRVYDSEEYAADHSHRQIDSKYDFRPSADEAREDRTYQYAILLED